MKRRSSISLTTEELDKLVADGKIRSYNETKLRKPETIAAAPVKRKSKFNNEKKEVDGIVFDSIKEANRYRELLLLLKAGEIGLLRRQVEYELNPNGNFSYRYVADFIYMTKEGREVVEDCKGFRTREYLKKRRLMKKIYNITIFET
ncbi:MAG: DUF1064 domain-containing protein [Agriterribacter sp.]